MPGLAENRNFPAAQIVHDVLSLPKEQFPILQSEWHATQVLFIESGLFVPEQLLTHVGTVTFISAAEVGQF